MDSANPSTLKFFRQLFMLTNRVMHNGAGYARKYLERSDYYAEGERITGHWFGQGAEKLGLSGEVQHEQFERVRAGLHPGTGDQLRQRRSTRNLYDFTFSAPKSVSVVAILGRDDRLFEAHDRAVREALGELERHAATRVRVNDQDTDRITGNLIVACYRHQDSRRLDPQIHTHCAAANMTFDPEEERWKALQAFGIYSRSSFLSEVYRNTLASELGKLGYEMVAGKYGPEIKGIPQELMDKFSLGSKAKREVIAAFKDKRGREPTRNEIAAEMRKVRPKKIKTEDLHAEQFARLTPDDKRTLAQVRDQADRSRGRIKTQTAEHSLQHAIEHVFERVSVAPDFVVLAEALKHGRGKVSLGDLKDALCERQSRNDIIREGDQIATRQSLDRELDSIHFVDRGIGKHDRMGRQPGNFQVSEKLNAEQRKVIDFVLDSRDFAVNIEGAAGTGKTTTLKELRRALQAGGRLMLAVAPTMEATQELQKAGFQNATTIESLLQNKDAHPHLTGRAIVVDEAGMVSGQQMYDLLSLASRFDARIIFSGDTKQIQSVPASDALRILLKESRLATVGLRDVQRQQTPGYKDAIETLRNDPARGLEKLAKMGAVITSGLFDRAEAVAEAYRKAKGTVLCVAPTHEEIARLTTAIRAGLFSRGKLGKEHALERLEPLNWTEAQKRDIGSFAPGQVLVFHKGTKQARKYEAVTVLSQDGNAVTARNGQGKKIHLTKKQAKSFSVFERRGIGVAAGDWLTIQANVRDEAYKFTNGERVKVAHVNEQGGIVLEDKRTIPHNFRQFTHGYAVTCHRSQGKTVDSVIISGDRFTKELFYVAASRGRKHITVFTSDPQQLRNSIGVSGERMSALELLRKSARTVERTRFAERTPTVAERIGQLIEKLWLNVPRLIFGQRFAPEREGMGVGR